MSYDIRGHLPPQVELLLQCYQKMDVDGMNRCMDNIRSIVRDTVFISSLDEYDAELKKALEDIEADTMKQYKDTPGHTNFVEVYQWVSEMVKDVELRINKVHFDYWDNIKKYVLLYVDSLYQQQISSEDEEQVDAG